MGCEGCTVRILYILLPYVQNPRNLHASFRFLLPEDFLLLHGQLPLEYHKIRNIQESGSGPYLLAWCRSSSELPWSEQHQGTSSCGKFQASSHNIFLPIPVLLQSSLPVWKYIPRYPLPLSFCMHR